MNNPLSFFRKLPLPVVLLGCVLLCIAVAFVISLAWDTSHPTDPDGVSLVLKRRQVQLRQDSIALRTQIARDSSRAARFHEQQALHHQQQSHAPTTPLSRAELQHRLDTY